MSNLNRRTFVQISTGAMAAAASTRLRGEAVATITNKDGVVLVEGRNYFWEYLQSNDRFFLRDSMKRLVVEGRMQPAVVVAPVGQPEVRRCSPGRVVGCKAETGRVTIHYEGVNGSANTMFTWRFNSECIWMDPVQYETSVAEDVVSIHYFTDGGANRLPTLLPSYLVVPGIVSAASVSPILKSTISLDANAWLGRGGGGPAPGLFQQWALPVHYFCGFSTRYTGSDRNLYTENRSDAFTCGLADLPGGDLYLQLHGGKASPWIDYRSDLWQHKRGPGKVTLGATFLWSIAPDYYDAIAAYYRQLLQAGIIRRKQNSPLKTAISLTPEFCTWGAQITRDKTGKKLDEEFLNGLYRDFKSSGMKAGLFSIDDKWEGAYGTLVHSEERLPHFEQFLDQLRADGLRIGMWAAIMRCESPSDIGLTLDHMLKMPDGKPYKRNNYYLIDFTQPEVVKLLSDLVRRFIRRYKPDVFKFDFGYELPSVAVAAPMDKQWTGERLMWKGLDVVIRAMKQENPDLVVMYYNLSPLFLDFFDLHSPDDLFADPGDYEVEANRRFFFSSLMGQLGVPTYGSSGYDWASSPSIWFDSAAVGTIGSLNDFRGDEESEVCTPEIIAKYNGIAKVLRATNIFEILPLETVSQSPTRGAHARSWARFESGRLVLLAQRPPISGEENPLMKPRDTRAQDVVRCAVPVVVASRDSDAIGKSSELAIVAYGGGEVAIRRQIGKSALIESHYFGGSVAQSHIQIVDGWLRIQVERQNKAGNPLEWIEVHSE
jgi:hypothetical protein